MTENAPEKDGFCPTCSALTDEMCTTPDGKVRKDHKRRHPMPGQVVLRPGVSEGGEGRG